jgi:S-adenosylmethionine hydrolase
MTSPLITLLSDFGAGSGYPAQMKGVILGLCPEARLVDLSHEIPAFQVLIGQALLRDAVATFPPGTIHVAVVDPGVGSARRPLLVVGGERAPGHLFVGPDNGLLWPFVRGGKVYELSNPALRRPEVSSTFHGRDIFAPAAAHQALGVPAEEFGHEVADPVRLQPPRVRHEGGAVVGEILYVDNFGNLISNLGAEELPPVELAKLKVAVGGRTLLHIRETYAEGAPGELMALIGSSRLLEVAVREGSAAALLAMEDPRGMPVVVEER